MRTSFNNLMKPAVLVVSPVRNTAFFRHVPMAPYTVTPFLRLFYRGRGMMLYFGAQVLLILFQVLNEDSST